MKSVTPNRTVKLPKPPKIDKPSGRIANLGDYAHPPKRKSKSK